MVQEDIHESTMGMEIDNQNEVLEETEIDASAIPNLWGGIAETSYANEIHDLTVNKGRNLDNADGMRVLQSLSLLELFAMDNEKSIILKMKMFSLYRNKPNRKLKVLINGMVLSLYFTKRAKIGKTATSNR